LGLTPQRPATALWPVLSGVVPQPLTPRLVAIDLDGTLLGDHGQVSARSVAALCDAAAAGIVVTIATGRPPVMLGALLDSANSAVSYVIGANGALVQGYPNGELLRLVGFDFDVARAAVEALRAADPAIGFALASNAGFAHEPGFAERMPAAVDTDPVDDVLAIGGTEAFKLIAFHPHIDTYELLDHLPGLLGDHLGSQLVTRHLGADAVELGPAGVDKGAALGWLCDHLEIASSEVVAFGDEWNDLTMLQWAGHGVAMANADQLVLDHADEIAPSNADDGVAVILERFLASS
jgi:Cof subfamily protein (haloacid dehalogenase superfamily)